MFLPSLLKKNGRIFLFVTQAQNYDSCIAKMHHVFYEFLSWLAIETHDLKMSYLRNIFLPKFRNIVIG
jgi:hypothetical protein